MKGPEYDRLHRDFQHMTHSAYKGYAKQMNRLIASFLIRKADMAITTWLNLSTKHCDDVVEIKVTGKLLAFSFIYKYCISVPTACGKVSSM